MKNRAAKNGGSQTISHESNDDVSSSSQRTPPSTPKKTKVKPATKQAQEKEHRSSNIDNSSSFLSRHRVTISIVLISVLAFLCVNRSFYPFHDSSLPGDTSASGSDQTTDEVTSIGGWRLASRATTDKYDPGICNVERVSIEDLPPSRFESEFRFRKPVLVTFPNGARGWTRPAYWTKEALVSQYKNWTVRSGQSLDIVRKGGNAKHKSSFLEFVDELLSHTEGDEPLHYGFDRDFYFSSDLPKTLHLPPYFAVNRTEDESIFFLGASLTGVVFHKHTDTWNGVVFGRKRWFLYPVTSTPPGGVVHPYTLLEWVNTIYPNLAEEDKPIECVQEAGEILYLPENAYHATLNLGDTIAVAIQKKHASTKVGELGDRTTLLNRKVSDEKDEEIKMELNQELVDAYTEMNELLPSNSEAHMRLGYYYGELKMYDESVKHSVQAIKMDPLFVMAYFHLGRALTALLRFEEAETTFLKAKELAPNLWDSYKEYGEFLMKMGRHKDALPVLKRGIELRPKSIPFWFYYKECQLETGDKEGAKLSEKIIVDLEVEEEVKKLQL